MKIFKIRNYINTLIDSILNLSEYIKHDERALSHVKNFYIKELVAQLKKECYVKVLATFSENNDEFVYSCETCYEELDAEDNYCKGCGKRLDWYNETVIR